MTGAMRRLVQDMNTASSVCPATDRSTADSSARETDST
jgi:hypothetical protein